MSTVSPSRVRHLGGIRFTKDAPLNIIWPVLTALALFVVTYFWLLLPSVEGHLMDRKREMIRAITDTACSTVAHYAQLAESGVISTKSAQLQAIENLRHLRFGPEGKDYFWINDMHPRIVMHPYRPDLEGMNAADITDPRGKHLFEAFVEKVRDEGAGYVDYQWQWMDDTSRVVDKISYVKGFAPWGWVIGTGVYVEDVRAQIAAITRHMTLIWLGITAVLGLLCVYIIWQGTLSEGKRRRIEDSLRQSEIKYRRLAETAREIIITFDSDYRITYANPAWRSIGNGDARPIEGESILDIIAPEYAEAFEDRIRQAARAEKGDALIDSAFCIGADGKLAPVEATLAVMPGADGKFHYLLAARDVTEKRKAAEQAQMQREQLYQSAKMASLGTLVSGVAHEINNPISAVMLNVQVFGRFWQSVRPVLDDYCAGGGGIDIGGMHYADISQRMPQLIEHTLDGVERVKRIVGDLKDFSGQRPNDLEEAVDLNTVVRKAAGLVASMIKKATVDFQCRYAEALPAFRGNGQRIEQVVINLLVNACQAMSDPQQPLRVATGVDKTGRWLFVEITDTGEGMPPEVLNRITDPFFTTRRDTGGTGLGLAISDTIIRDHGGRLQFDSRPGRGTTVAAWVPVGGAMTP